ncbi:hypothetical protein ACHAWF_001709, partial [Thalassiosira exigua]
RESPWADAVADEHSGEGEGGGRRRRDRAGDDSDARPDGGTERLLRRPPAAPGRRRDQALRFLPAGDRSRGHERRRGDPSDVRLPRRLVRRHRLGRGHDPRGRQRGEGRLVRRGPRAVEGRRGPGGAGCVGAADLVPRSGSDARLGSVLRRLGGFATAGGRRGAPGALLADLGRTQEVNAHGLSEGRRASLARLGVRLGGESSGGEPPTKKRRSGNAGDRGDGTSRKDAKVDLVDRFLKARSDRRGKEDSAALTNEGRPSDLNGEEVSRGGTQLKDDDAAPPTNTRARTAAVEGGDVPDEDEAPTKPAADLRGAARLPARAPAMVVDDESLAFRGSGPSDANSDAVPREGNRGKADLICRFLKGRSGDGGEEIPDGDDEGASADGDANEHAESDEERSSSGDRDVDVGPNPVPAAREGSVWDNVQAVARSKLVPLCRPFTALDGRVTSGFVELTLPALPAKLGLRVETNPIFDLPEVHVSESSPIASQIPRDLRSGSFVTLIESPSVGRVRPASARECAEAFRRARLARQPFARVAVNLAKNPMHVYVPEEFRGLVPPSLL